METNLHIDEIELDYGPRKEIIPNLPRIKGEPEMSVFESAFLCGILNRFKPRKILEVGIAGGGTTAIILQCMADQGNPFELHSVDYSKEFYRDRQKQSGFLGIEAKKHIKSSCEYSHYYHLDNVACAFREEIGGDIDCLILDTIHLSPGEILDFITLLPLLKDGCAVLLHDTIFSHICRYKDKYRYATTLLLAAVKGEKYVNFDEKRKAKMPNIAAFVVEQETRKNIADLFLSLVVTWNFMPYRKQLEAYRECISEYYESVMLKVYDSAVMMNKDTYYTKGQTYSFPFLRVPNGSRVILYGAGNVGNVFKRQVKRHSGITVEKWVDIRGDDFGDDEIESIEAIMDAQYDYIIIAIEDETIAADVRRNLSEQFSVPSEKIIWENYRKV